MDYEPKQSNKPLCMSCCESITPSRSFIALEFRLVGTVEDEDWLDGRAEKTDKSIEERSDSRVRAACLL